MTDVCTLAQVKDTLEITDTERDELIARLIRGATTYIEKKTVRSLSTGVSQKLYDGYDKGYLEVKDFQSCTAVELLNNDNTVWKTFNVSTELRFYPYNDGELPKTQIIIQSITSENPYRVIGRSPYIFPRGIANVRVTANWGSYATVPDNLTDLGISMIAAKLSKVKYRGLKSASLGGESISFSDKDLDDGMLDMLSTYKRQFVEVW